MLKIKFEYGQEDRVSVEYGPYEFVQITYEDMRVGIDGEITLAQYDNGLWYTIDKQSWTDVIVYTA